MPDELKQKLILFCFIVSLIIFTATGSLIENNSDYLWKLFNAFSCGMLAGTGLKIMLDEL